MERRKIRVIGMPEVCYEGLLSILSDIPSVDPVQEPGADISDLALHVCSNDIYMLASCGLKCDVIPLCGALRRASERVGILVWGGGSEVSAVRTLAAGASAYVPDCTRNELLQAIGALCKGEHFFDLALLRHDIVASQSDRHPSCDGSFANRPKALGLTQRQLDVLQMAADGSTDKEISLALGISPHTVRSHLRVIFKRQGVSRRSELHVRNTAADGAG